MSTTTSRSEKNDGPLEWKVPRPAGRKATTEHSAVAEALMAVRLRRPGKPGAPSRPERVKRLPGAPIEIDPGQLSIDDALDDPEFNDAA